MKCARPLLALSIAAFFIGCAGCGKSTNRTEANAASKADQSAALIGKWSKDYFEESGRVNNDQRWRVHLQFKADGSFSWQSGTIPGPWLESGEDGTKVNRHEAAFQGTYTAANDMIVFRLSEEPTGENLIQAKRHLGYETGNTCCVRMVTNESNQKLILLTVPKFSTLGDTLVRKIYFSRTVQRTIPMPLGEKP